MHQKPRILVPIENNNIAPLIINCKYPNQGSPARSILENWENSEISDYLTEFHKSQNEVYFIYVVNTTASTETENGKL